MYSIDFIWSFDEFVHISPEDIENYVREFKRVMILNGLGIIHHAGECELHGSYRSSFTNELFNKFIKVNNLHLDDQYDSWGNERQYNVKYYHDTISVFKKN
jgi:hypothetical protein